MGADECAQRCSYCWGILRFCKLKRFFCRNIIFSAPVDIMLWDNLPECAGRSEEMMSVWVSNVSRTRLNIWECQVNSFGLFSWSAQSVRPKIQNEKSKLQWAAATTQPVLNLIVVDDVQSVWAARRKKKRRRRKRKKKGGAERDRIKRRKGLQESAAKCCKITDTHYRYVHEQRTGLVFQK